MFFIVKWRTMKFHIMLFVFCITNIYSVPEDYCFGVLDKRDCGLPPTPVFSYSKPGSRCEIETWRGCPSENLFQNEYQCSDLCIGKLFRTSGEGQTSEPSKEEKDDRYSAQTMTGKMEATDTAKTIKCDEPLNTDNCTDEETQVFTFDNATRACVETTYRGCETENKFYDKEQCENSCLNNKDQWASSINKLEDKDLENIKDIVDKAAEGNETTEHPESLKHAVSDDKAPKVEEPNKEKDSGSIEEAVILRHGEKQK